jgi:hypothetical protein
MFRTFILILIVFSIIFSSISSSFADPGVNVDDEKEGDCKVIVVMNDATAGDYNMHMKVRDPSRKGGQYPFLLEPGYNYTYQHPLTGELMNFTTKHKIIGIATKGDIPPSILKPGMVLTSAGISIGDADNPTLEHINKNTSAWDDFDWMRYAFQTANSEEEAVRLLTEVAVDELHATSIGETLFVVGPDKGYAIEADAEHYYIHEIKEYYAKSNYAEFLWEQCSYFTDKYAPAFETKFNGWAIENQTIKLGSECSHGVRILKINENTIIARKYPDDGKNVTINVGDTENVYNFRVKVLDINSTKNTVHLTVCYKYLEWREKVNEMVNTKASNITIRDMMSWSRLHSDDLDGLRGFCEGSRSKEESVAIFKHPKERPEMLSCMWFSGIPRTSIFVPQHIGSKYLFDAIFSYYIPVVLLENYSHGELTPILERVEDVLINENNFIEDLCLKFNFSMNETLQNILLFTDGILQQNAFDMQRILEQVVRIRRLISNSEPIEDIDRINRVINTINKMWDQDFNRSYTGFKLALIEIQEILNDYNWKNNTLKEYTRDEFERIMDHIIQFVMINSKSGVCNTLFDRTHPSMVQAQLYIHYAADNRTQNNYRGFVDNFHSSYQIYDNLLRDWPKSLVIDGEDEQPGDGNGTPEDNPDDEEKEPDIDGGYDPDDMEPTDPTKINNSSDTKDQRPTWSRVDYMLITGIILLVIILVAINVSTKKKT